MIDKDANGNRVNRGFRISPMTEHLHKPSKHDIGCALCGMNINAHGHVLARRHAAGKDDRGIPQ